MMDFLTFKSFISPAALIVLYYTGAVILPVASWAWALRLIGRSGAAQRIYQKGRHALWQNLNYKQRTRGIVLFVGLFLLMELFWRMLFEFLIAYMQIHGALVSAAI